VVPDLPEVRHHRCSLAPRLERHRSHRRTGGALGTLVLMLTLDEALRAGVCVLILFALAAAIVGVWRDDHAWMDGRH